MFFPSGSTGALDVTSSRLLQGLQRDLPSDVQEWALGTSPAKQPSQAVLAAMAIGPTDEDLKKVEKDLG